MKDNKNSKKKFTSKQIVALIGVFLLVALYLVTLFVAIFNPDGSGRMFQACLVATVAVPVLLWIYIWMYGKLTNRHTIADPDYLKDLKLDDEETQG
ncbi:MAG: hypothetical protein IJN16_11445 [Lachnospiraceae bacterium]|nr:hypothetical protein [Lachnospiraceae bacterium]